jgi:hypothetical protein
MAAPYLRRNAGSGWRADVVLSLSSRAKPQ